MPTTDATTDRDLAIPVLPSRSLQATVDFYARLGFDGEIIDGVYAILTQGDVEIHFFLHTDIVPGDSWAGCYLRMIDVAPLYQAFQAAQLPAKGIPRMDLLADKPWGMREFAVVDEDGNLLRIGQVLD
ncbi:MAG: VOC family protein [Burkholderiales bacterium]|nr:MAG: VOC family protein [Burkholderiales bacterium]